MARGPVEVVEVTDLVADLASLVDRLQPDTIPDLDVAPMVQQLAQAKRLVDAAVTLMARRVAESEVHRRAGQRSAADYLATVTGTTTARARQQLATSTHLASQSATQAAIRRGALSTDQATAVTAAVAADPTAEAHLLAGARHQGLADLRQDCRQVRHRADPDAEATRRRHHDHRSFTSWTESDGEWCARLTAPKDLGARIEAALRRRHDAAFRSAHRAGRREADACYRFDAVLETLEAGNACDGHQPAGANSAAARDAAPDARGDTTTDCHPKRTTARQAMVIITVDGAALQRGRLHRGETCRIEGIGDVALSAVLEQIPQAHIAYVIRDGRTVNVTHLGRQVTAHQRTAMLARGYVCEVPGCTNTHLLEIDHRTDWAFTHRTQLDELAWLCIPHHQQKTRRGHRLLGPPGQRIWTTDLGHQISRDPPVGQLSLA